MAFVGSRRALLASQKFNPYAAAFFARLATQPSQTRKALYNSLFNTLSASGALSSIDVLCVVGADQATSLTNLMQASFGATAVKSPTFVADRYFVGDGSSKYIDTNFTPSTAGGHFALNASAVGVWSLTSGLSAGTQIGSNDLSTRTRLQANSTTSFALLSTSALPTWSNTASDGFFLSTRKVSTDINVYRNGLLDASLSESSASLTTKSIYVCGLNNNGTFGVGSTAQISAWIIGGNLDAYQADIYNAIYNYLTAIGAVS